MAHREWTVGMGRADSVGRKIRRRFKELRGLLVGLVTGSK